MTSPVEISSAELAIYDRQIRLWGLEAQNRLRNSAALIYGMSLLGAEVGKNLMLCGLNKLVVADCKSLGDGKNFLVDSKTLPTENRAAASFNGLKVLNPMVKLEAKSMEAKQLTSEFLKNFDIVILIDQGEELITKVDGICRENQIRFIAGGIFGWTGYTFFDFNGFEFLISAPKNHALVDEENDDGASADGPSTAKKLKKEQKIETITLEEDDAKIKQKFTYPSFSESIALDKAKLTKGIFRRTKPVNYLIVNALLEMEKKLGHPVEKEDLHHYLEKCDPFLKEIVGKALNNEFELVMNPPFPSTCSIVGGILSQEAIKALSQNDVPFQNFFAYNAVDAMGYVYNLPLIK